MTNDRWTFKRIQRLERRCLVPECFTTKAQHAAQSDRETIEYVFWLEAQCGEFFSALN